MWILVRADPGYIVNTEKIPCIQHSMQDSSSQSHFSHRDGTLSPQWWFASSPPLFVHTEPSSSGVKTHQCNIYVGIFFKDSNYNNSNEWRQKHNELKFFCSESCYIITVSQLLELPGSAFGDRRWFSGRNVAELVGQTGWQTLLHK